MHLWCYIGAGSSALQQITTNTNTQHQTHKQQQTNTQISATEIKTAMRFSLTLEGKAEERLSKLTASGESKAEVLRSALALEDIYQEANKRGATFIVREPDGTLKELFRV